MLCSYSFWVVVAWQQYPAAAAHARTQDFVDGNSSPAVPKIWGGGVRRVSRPNVHTFSDTAVTSLQNTLADAVSSSPSTAKSTAYPL